MRVLVCGSRYWDNVEVIEREIRRVHEQDGIDVIIHGGAKGADTIGGEVAARMEIPVEVYKADWTRLGPRAGPIRNAKMLALGNPDLVIAFHPNLDLSRGTRDMVKRARRRGVTIIHVTG